MLTTIIYDLDGTLVDSASTVAALLNRMRIERSMAPLPVSSYKPWLSIGGKAMIAGAFDTPEEDSETVDLLNLFRSRYLSEPTDLETVYPKVQHTLSKLSELRLRLGLCTNKPRLLTEKVLKETNLDAHFEVICAGDDLATRKPHPNNLQVCLSALHSKPTETLVVGDSRVDQLLAENSGAFFAFFRKGYDDGVQLSENILTLDDHEEILDHLTHF